ncbi:MAG: hypothetical protein WAK93_08620 [Solirubrobacteraceae bacterium]
MEVIPPVHHTRVEELLADAAARHAALVAQLPNELSASLPVDAQGVAEAIDYLATEAGFSERERRDLIRPHAVNPAVLHARVFGRAPLARDTVIGAFVDGARVRADALSALADSVGGEPLGQEIRSLLVEHPPPVGEDDHDAVDALRATYAAHEQAVLAIAARLDAEVN